MTELSPTARLHASKTEAGGFSLAADGSTAAAAAAEVAEGGWEPPAAPPAATAAGVAKAAAEVAKAAAGAVEAAAPAAEAAAPAAAAGGGGVFGRVALLLHTSGTTSTPKTVPLTHGHPQPPARLVILLHRPLS